MLALHIPGLKDWKDTIGNNLRSESGTSIITFEDDYKSPFTYSMAASGTSSYSLHYTPRMHRSTQATLAFWFNTAGKPETDTSSVFLKFLGLYTDNKEFGNTELGTFFRMELSSATAMSFNFFNNGMATGNGGIKNFSIEKNTWYYIILLLDLEAASWEYKIYKFPEMTLYNDKGTLPRQNYCYFTDNFVLQKPAQISSVKYADIRVYDEIISDYTLQQLLRREVVHYSFDTIGDTLSNVTDISTMGNNPTFNNAGRSTDNVVGYSCAAFDNTKKQYLQLPECCKIKRNFTIMFWMKKPDLWTGHGSDYTNQSPCGCGTAGVSFYCRDNFNIYWTASGTTIYYGVLDSKLPKPEPNTWHHVCVRFDHTNGKVQSFVDGIPNSNIKEITEEYRPQNPTYSYCIGAAGTTVNHAVGWYFNGELDDFRIFASALSDKDIEMLYKERLAIDDKNNVHCRWITESSGDSIDLLTDGSFEYLGSDGTRPEFDITRSTEEVAVGEWALKVADKPLAITRNLTGWAGVTISYNAQSKEYTLNGTTSAAGGLANFLFFTTPDVHEGDTITCTLDYVSGSCELTNATSGACYACPVIDVGLNGNTNVSTRHWVDMRSYPTATSKQVKMSLNLTAADVAEMKGIRIWLHTRGANTAAATPYGATIVTFTNYKFKITLEQTLKTRKDGNFKLRDVSSFLSSKHRYFLSAKLKTHNAAGGYQFYLGAWEKCPIAGTIPTSDGAWHDVSGITDDSWAKNFKDNAKYLRFDFDNTKHTDIENAVFVDDIQLVDLSEHFGGGLKGVAASTTEGNTLSGLKFQVYKKDGTFSQKFSYSTPGKREETWTKEADTSYIRFGFNGSKKDSVANVNVADWPEGDYTFEFNLLSMDGAAAAGEFTVIPKTPAKILLDDLTLSQDLTTTIFDTGLIPSLADCNKLYVSKTDSNAPGLTFCDRKGLIKGDSISEYGRPLRYFKWYSSGSNKNAAEAHLMHAEVNTVDAGKILLADFASGYMDGIISSHGLDSGWINGGNPCIFDLKAIYLVSSVTISRFYADSRYYYKGKLEGSLDNKTYFTIFDSHNMGTYTTDASKDDVFNTYPETAEGQTFYVRPDKVYLTKTGKIIANQFIGE